MDKVSSREELLCAMYENSHVPCFIRAPHAFGRTELASSYASKYYEDVKTVWINGCGTGFKESLENDMLIHYVSSRQGELHINDTGRLLIIDDLDIDCEDYLAERLSNDIDTLIEQGWQVIAIESHIGDVFCDLQSDRMTITPGDIIERYGLDPKSRRNYLKRFFKDHEHEVELSFAAASIIILQDTCVDELRLLGLDITEDDFIRLCALNPLFTYDHITRRVSIDGLDILPIQDVLLSSTKAWLKAHSDGVQDVSASHVANILTRVSAFLLDRDDVSRSHELLRVIEGLLGLTAFDVPTHSVPRSGPQPMPLLEPRHAPKGTSGWTPRLEPGQNALAGSSKQAERAYGFDHASAPVSLAPVSSAHVSSAPVSSAPVSSAPISYEHVYDADAASAARERGLRVKMFGEFEVHLNGKRLVANVLQNGKLRTLLCYLTLNKGKAVARETLMSHMWPTMDPHRALSNFYVTWSRLAKALDQDGKGASECLVKVGSLVRMDMDTVKSDVADADNMMRIICFSKMNAAERIQAAFSLEKLYHGDILAGSRVDPYIAAFQERYRLMFVDSMLCAMRLCIGSGDFSNAMWLARRAHDVDSSRDDVCQALMHVQIKSGQRSSALKTYFSSRDLLSQHTGLMPSRKTTEMYHNLLLDSYD
jgi:DNA-binding SARP family transcriptional activator